MRQAKIFSNNIPIGILSMVAKDKYIFEYDEGYHGLPVSLTMPILQKRYEFENFPPFFEGLLPEGPQLEALLRQAKLDRFDYFGQLLAVGTDLVGAITVEEMK